MNLVTYPSKDFDRLVSHASQPLPEVEKTVREIIRRVRTGGDQALLELTQKYQGLRLSQKNLRVRGRELASAKIDPKLAAALKDSLNNIRKFAAKSLEPNWSMRNSHGGRVGERFAALERVGIYVPGGTAPLVSSVLMTVGLAQAAGVREIVVCTPAPISSPILFALKICGATEVYRAGGAQAIAAMAFGTETIRAVPKIVGPGNAYVTEAKRQVFGQVGIDLLAGPSEVMIIADRTASMDWVAADLLAQAEHGAGSRVYLVSDCPRLLADIEMALGRHLGSLWDRKDQQRQRRHIYALEVLKHTFFRVSVKNLDAAAKAANEIAPEHLQIMARDGRRLAEKISTAGAIFVGASSPTALGDYVAGPSHTLPTGGAGKAFSGLRVQDFRRRTSVVEYDSAGLKKALNSLEAIAHAEGLEAHARSARIRVSK